MKKDSEILDDFVIEITRIARMNCEKEDQVKKVVDLIIEQEVNISCAAITLLAILEDRKVEKIIQNYQNGGFHGH